MIVAVNDFHNKWNEGAHKNISTFIILCPYLKQIQ